MRKVTIFYNPVAGRKQDTRLTDISTVAAVLREHKIEVLVTETSGSDGTAVQVRQAAESGSDAIIACGGDGTIHNVLQGLVGSNAALGVIPMGTANSLAKDLRIPRSPIDAAHVLLNAKTKRIAVGKVICNRFSGETVSRFFTVAAGVGVDAEVFQRFTAEKKKRLGHAGYYVEAAKLWLTHPLHKFEAKVRTDERSGFREEEISQLLAVRIQNFGGLLRKLAPGASLERNDLRLVLFHTKSRFAYLSHIFRGFAGAQWNIRGIEVLDAQAAICRPLNENAAQTLVEADGELLGTLPAEISIIPDALTMLIPQSIHGFR